MPTKNYLVRQICMKAWTIYTSRCMMIYENLTDELSMKRLESKLSIKITDHFCKSGGLFNCEEKGKTLLSVVF